MAESLGATCCDDVSECTHLVAVLRKQDGYTNKLLDSLAPPPPGKAPVEIVRPDWLYASRGAWKRMNEEDFRVFGWADLRERAAAAIAERQRRLASGRSSHEVGDGGPGSSRKRRRESRGADGAGPSQDLQQRAEQTLVSDAQALLKDLDSMLHDSMLSGSPSTGSAGDDNETLDEDDEYGNLSEDDLEAQLDQESDDQDAIEVTGYDDEADEESEGEEAVDQDLDLY